jgi:hypothetical protein
MNQLASEKSKHPTQAECGQENGEAEMRLEDADRLQARGNDPGRFQSDGDNANRISAEGEYAS